MQKQFRNYLVFVILLAILIAPSFALASWWNPFSWGVWNRVFHFQRTEQKQEQQKNQQEKNQPSCTDSDGGINYNVKGTLSIVQNGKYRTEEDYCEENFLHEFYCHGNDPAAANVESGGYLCLNGCENGACKQTKDQTTGWKTYTNTEYGFEIKYPANNWGLLVDTPTPNGRLLYEMQISAVAESDDFAGSVQLYIQSGNVDSWLSNKATHTRETVYINGLRAEKFYFGRDPKTDNSRTYVFEKNNLVYVINTALVIDNKYGISENDISQILSTFKFIK